MGETLFSSAGISEAFVVYLRLIWLAKRSQNHFYLSLFRYVLSFFPKEQGDTRYAHVSEGRVCYWDPRTWLLNSNLSQNLKRDPPLVDIFNLVTLERCWCSQLNKKINGRWGKPSEWS